MLHNKYLLTFIKFSLIVTNFAVCTAKKDEFRSVNCFAKFPSDHWSFHLYLRQCHLLHNLHSLQKVIHRRKREVTRRPIPRIPSWPRRSAKVLWNKFQQALHRVTWSVSWTWLFWTSVAGQVSRKVELLSIFATVKSFTVQHNLVWSHSVLLRYANQKPEQQILRPASKLPNKFRHLMSHGTTSTETYFEAPLHICFSQKFQLVPLKRKPIFFVTIVFIYLLLFLYNKEL